MSRNLKARMGHLLAVQNKKAVIGSLPEYVGVRTQVGDKRVTALLAQWGFKCKVGDEGCPLFTPWELQRAFRRAAKNPEDVLKPAWLIDFFD